MTARGAGHTTSHVVGPFACFGERWQIACDDVALARLVGELYAPMLDLSTEQQPVLTYRLISGGRGRPGGVYRGDELLVESSRPSRLMGKLVWAINRQVIDASEDRLLLHAAAAADADGRVVLLPAPMESGKTTLVTGLLDRGLAYLSDEACAVDHDLTVTGFAKPLSIDRGSWDTLKHHAPDLPEALAPYLQEQWQVPPHHVGRVVPGGALATIVFPTYLGGATTSLSRLAPVAALDRGRGCAFGSEDRWLSADKLAALAHVVASVPCYELRSGDLSEACTAVLETLEGVHCVP